MRDGGEIRRAKRKPRRLVSVLAFGVLVLAAWVLATNMIFSPRDTAESPATSQTTIASKTVPPELDPSPVTAPRAGSVDQAAPAPERTATSELTVTADGKPGAELTNPVDIAAVMPSMGGIETLLSPTLVSRSVESASVVSNGLVPRPRVVAIPLPRPRPAFTDPRLSGQAITNSELFKPQTY